MLVQHAAFDQRTEMLLERVVTDSGQFNGLTDGNAAVFADNSTICSCSSGMTVSTSLLALDLLPQATHLLSQGAKEEHQPRLPVRCLCADRALSPPLRSVISSLALFDHALQGAVRHINLTPLPISVFMDTCQIVLKASKMVYIVHLIQKPIGGVRVSTD